ncbi:hypothetical protein MKZ23_11100 [Paenibacillus sp. FSL R5-0876]|uniref:hypothetical protein n=1 Tax=Paenibacillus sp. FSL R5-0876 TaxID=2921661 RepID=UPI0030FCCCB4
MEDLFKVIFDDIFAGQSKKSRLQKNGDTGFELDYWIQELRNQGKQPIHYETTKNAEIIIIFREPIDEEMLHIVLRSKIFSQEGIRSFTPSMNLLYKKKNEILEIADLRVEVQDANKGYGSAFMRALFLLIEEFPYPIKYITGWIAGTDWGHIDRNKYFYEKFRFEVKLDHEIRDGYILWINSAKTGSKEHYESLNYKPGIAGLMQELSEYEDEE